MEKFFTDRLVRLFAQNLHAQRMERANSARAFATWAAFRRRAPAFPQRLFGKGNCGDGMRQIADSDNQMLNFLSNYQPVFAAACAGKDERGSRRGNGRLRAVD